ncbi:hypothetical protein BCU33_022800 [Vibrio lentus]|uniref:hypothetical protein n=7 Tax=Vibrio TaxID=662 RepID=UPI000C867196|nr:hypothetical protein [Vibrio lentus]PMI96408.1 hypothetical protein BCU33_00525 [Vibrio lentus]
MKASLLAISISSVLAAPVFASALQIDVELANQQTLQLIDGQMNAIDASVQYKLNEQYANATPGTTATVDDVTYEKQSNGTWAAVGAASATLVAGLLSTSSSSNNDNGVDYLPQHPDVDVDATPRWSPEFGEDRPEMEERDLTVKIINGEIHIIDENTSEWVGTVQRKDGEIIFRGNGDFEKTLVKVEGDLEANGSAAIVKGNGEWLATVERVDSGFEITGSNGTIVVDSLRPSLPASPEHPDMDFDDTPRWSPEFGEDRPEMEERDLTVKIINGEIHIIDENTSEWVGTVQRKDGEIIFRGNGDFEKTLVKVEGDLEANGSAAIVKGNGEWLATVERVDSGFEITGSNGTIVVDSLRPSLPASPEHPDMDFDDTPRWSPEFGEDRPEMEERDLTVKIINGEIHIIDENTSEWVGTVQRKDGEIIFRGNGDFEKTLVKVEGDLEANGSAALVKGNGDWLATVERVDNGFEITSGKGTIVIDSPRPTLPASPEHPDMDFDDTPRWSPDFGEDRPEMEERDLTVKIINGEIHIIDENTSEWVGTVQRKDGELVFIGNGDFEKTLLRVEGDVTSDQFSLVKGNGQWVATVSKIDDGVRIQTKNHDHVFDGSNIDRSKLQSIDPTKLQKAKSAIQQRLRS